MLLAVEVDTALVETLRQEPIVTLLDDVAPGTRRWLELFDPAQKELADEEFTRLFILPGGTPPRAAAWMPGEIATVGAALSQTVSQVLSVLGRELDDGLAGNLPLDHLAVLLDLAAVADDRDGAEAAHDAGGLGPMVFRQLVAPWRKAFGLALLDQAQVPLYRAAASLLIELPDPEPRPPRTAEEKAT